MARRKSEAYFKRASRLLVGGVNSPVRAFRGVGGTPVAFKRAKGPYFWDLDGNRYTDFVLSWGPLILGHAPAAVLKAIRSAAGRGTSFGAGHELELELAVMVRRFFPSMEKVRFVSSGTEAAMSALRLARGATGRALVLKFEGCYHGHADALLVKAGSGAATLGVPDSAGVTPAQAKDTLTLPFNDTEGVKALFKRQGGRIAAAIVEPFVGNMGFVRPGPGFLEALRRECTRHGALLIFDEVMTGFRVHPRGAQGLLGITPDLTCLGKVIGGGLPVGAFGGPARLMDRLAPLGPVYQAGTLSGNPLAMAAGIATLKACAKPGFYEGLAKRLELLLSGWRRLFALKGIPSQVDGQGTMFGIFFAADRVRNFSEARGSNVQLFTRFFHAMLEEGIYLAPSAFEAGFISSAHTPAVLSQVLEKTRKALNRL